VIRVFVPICSAAEEAFNANQAQGSGLDVIFMKLAKMEKKIKDEQSTEKVRMNAYNARCNKELKRQTTILTVSSKTRSDVKQFTGNSNKIIKENRLAWRSSRNDEDKSHRTVVDLQTAREESMQATNAQVDELNKAIDVMQAALFLVCERFNR